MEIMDGSSTPGGTVTIPQVEHARLRNIEREYAVTVRVLAVVVERAIENANAHGLVVTDEALMNAPDLRAWREQEKYQVVIQVSR